MKYDIAQRMNGFDLLRSINDESAALVVMDPQYRGILDKLKYGNEGERQSERSALPQMTDQEISRFIDEAERILRPSGHLLFWTDKFTIGSGRHLRYFHFMSSFQIVDLIAWNKARIGMGRRARCTTEYLLIVQKQPIRAKDVWTDHSIADSWTEKKPEGHPHAKPSNLMTRLIEATTSVGDIVVDPCAGGFGVLDICVATGRKFLGCDLRASARHLSPKPEGVTMNGSAEIAASVPTPAPPGPSAADLLARLRGGMKPMRIPKLNAGALK